MNNELNAALNTLHIKKTASETCSLQNYELKVSMQFSLRLLFLSFSFGTIPIYLLFNLFNLHTYTDAHTDTANILSLLLSWFELETTRFATRSKLLPTAIVMLKFHFIYLVFMSFFLFLSFFLSFFIISHWFSLFCCRSDKRRVWRIRWFTFVIFTFLIEYLLESNFHYKVTDNWHYFSVISPNFLIKLNEFRTKNSKRKNEDDEIKKRKYRETQIVPQDVTKLIYSITLCIFLLVYTFLIL